MDPRQGTSVIQQKQQVEEKVRHLIYTHLKKEVTPEQVDADKPLQNQGVDSFEFMSLLIDLEDAFDITISDEDLMTKPMDTLKELVDFIMELTH